MAAIYEVPPDALHGQVALLTSDAVAARNKRTHSLHDVLVAASVLAQVPKFPLDMIDEVLEMADFVVTFEASTEELRRGRSDMNEVYLESRLPQVDEMKLPPGVTIGPNCIELEVECSSHDQGWASQDNQYDRTYYASFTWSEIAVVKHDENDGKHEATRQKVIVNVRAQSQFRHHIKKFVDPKGLIQHIALGDTLQLILRSQYPGWANTANFGRLRARFRVGINEDARLLTLQQLARERIEEGQSSEAILRTAINQCCVQ